jgi:hypothetical protein
MTEREFWGRLEWRLGAEFDGLPERRHRYLWCDGLIPEEYLLEGPRPRIEGTAFMGNSGQDRWRFVLFLGRAYQSVEEIDWCALLPPDGVTCWMCFDERERWVEMEPGVARDLV